MKREIKNVKSAKSLDQCCPGHDDFPCDTYRNRRSKKARSKGIAREHRYVRRIVKLSDKNTNPLGDA